MISTNNLNISSVQNISSPDEIKKKYEVPRDLYESIHESRQIIHNIINKKDPRLLVIIGPCSIHDEEAVQHYSDKLALIKSSFPNLFIVMRVYFEKPRTITGWKGLIMDPDLDGTCDINKGLYLARKIMVDIVEKEIPIACEFLDTISAQYISCLVSYGAIGARTTQSQLHRQMSSGLSVPIGFKNTTDGNINIAINSILASRESHTFLGIDKHGQASIVKTRGNKNCHLVLRGGKTPNYNKESVEDATRKCIDKNIHSGIIIDCSHGNSHKDFRNQKVVVDDVCKQLSRPSCNIIGVMIESNIYEGKQVLVHKDNLLYGVSITDSCISLAESEKLLHKLNNTKSQVFI